MRWGEANYRPCRGLRRPALIDCLIQFLARRVARAQAGFSPYFCFRSPTSHVRSSYSSITVTMLCHEQRRSMAGSCRSRRSCSKYPPRCARTPGSAGRTPAGRAPDPG